MNSDYMKNVAILFQAALLVVVIGVIGMYTEKSQPRPSIRILANGQDFTYRLGDIERVVITDKSTTIYCGEDLVVWKNGEHNKFWRGNN